MKTIESIKLNIIEIVMSIENEGILTKFEDEAIKIKAQKNNQPKLSNAIKPIRTNVTLEQLKKEQNYQAISYEEFRQLADKIEIKEPIEELLGMLTK